MKSCTADNVIKLLINNRFEINRSHGCPDMGNPYIWHLSNNFGLMATVEEDIDTKEVTINGLNPVKWFKENTESVSNL